MQGGTTTPPPNLKSRSDPPSSSPSSRPIDNGIIYPLKPSPSPATSSSSQTTSQLITKDPREQLFFQYLTLFLLTLWIPLTCLKDWPASRSFLYRSSELPPVAASNKSSEEGGERGGYGNELQLGYSFPCIGASFVMAGSTMLALNLGSNPMWRFFEWQTSLMDGFGYAIFVVGIVYILLGLGPWELRTLRDDYA
ncbi:hypothetical protein BGZ88_003359 [Linnemannia elongata]|nr:hypothetical protein BGZ88_003359 [Linnemannia elongata]